jgi:catechol 2,3-dioxygenase-like lactoylglutathione lyase family enzyme
MLGLEAPVQIAYAVPDAEAAAQAWHERFGAGPFFVRRHIPVSDVVYRGAPSTFDHTSAYGQWGEVMVELVQDHGTAPSIVRERYAPNESGLHHVAYMVAALDETIAHLEAAGLPLAMDALANGRTRFVFVDAVGTLGHMLELYEGSDGLRGFYAMVREAAVGWDGTEAVRII